MSNIPERQNQPRFLNYLAAQRQLYNEDRRWTYVWFAISIVVAILATGILLVFASQEALVTWFVILVAVGELVFFRKTTAQRLTAAKIQEQFDCELLELEWNDALTRRPDPKAIELAVERFNKQKTSEEAWRKLHDWFQSPELGAAPIHQARIMCQRENIRWDSGQRREWARWLIGLIAAFIVVLVCIGILAGLSVEQLISGLVVVTFPLAYAVGKQASENNEAADRLDHLESVLETLWNDALHENANIESITQRTRNVQNEIFHHRASIVPVPNWVYKRLRKKYEPPSGSLNSPT